MAHMLLIFGLVSSGLHTGFAQECLTQAMGLLGPCPISVTDVTNLGQLSQEKLRDIGQAVCDPGECKTAADELLLNCGDDSTVQSFAGPLLSMCEPCQRTLLTFNLEQGASGKCPNTTQFGDPPSASQIDKLCSTDCMSTMNSTVDACDSNPSMQSVAGSMRSMLSICDPCQKSFMMLSANCKEGGKDGAPNIEAGCGDCRIGFEALLAVCPEDVSTSPIRGIPLQSYKSVTSDMRAKLKTCATTTSTMIPTATTPATEADGAFRHGLAAAAFLSLACICF